MLFFSTNILVFCLPLGSPRAFCLYRIPALRPQCQSPGSGLWFLRSMITLLLTMQLYRAAILIRMNTLIRGHSGIRWVRLTLVFFLYEFIFDRWELIEKMNELVSANITPVIPLRGSISASGGSWILPCGRSLDPSFLMRNRPLPTILHCWSLRCVDLVALTIFLPILTRLLN